MFLFSGNASGSQIIQVLLSTNMFVGGFTGFVLDNLLPGTEEERGIVKWRKSHELHSASSYSLAPITVYDPPFLPKKLKSSKFAKWCPFLPYYSQKEVDGENSL